jgi:hypothetical protein
MHGRLQLRLAAAAALLVAAGAPIPSGAAVRDVTVTVYNSNLALVKDVRTLDLGSGKTTLRFTDVSAQIDPRRSI